MEKLSSNQLLILEILKIVVPFFATIISFVIGYRSNYSSRRYEIYKNRFEQFYVPFMSFYRTEILHVGKLGTHLDKLIEFSKYLNGNFQYMGRHMQKEAVLFADIAVNPELYSEGMLWTTWERLLKAFLSEYRWLCKKLGYSRPKLPPLPVFFRNKAAQESKVEETDILPKL